LDISPDCAQAEPANEIITAVEKQVASLIFPFMAKPLPKIPASSAIGGLTGRKATQHENGRELVGQGLQDCMPA
jgi:hypothetical protein